MTYIFINKSKFKKLGNTVEKVGKRVRDIDDDFNSVRNKLDWDIQASENIDRRLEDIHNDLERYVNVLEKMKSFLEEAERAYELLDKESLEDIESIIEPIALPVEQDNKILNNIAKWFGERLSTSFITINDKGKVSFNIPNLIDFRDLVPKSSDSLWGATNEYDWGKVAANIFGYEATANGLTGFLSSIKFASESERLKQSAELALGKVQLSNSLSIDEKGHAKLDIGAKASVVEGSYKLTHGNQYINSTTVFKGSIAKGETSALAEFGWDEEGLDAYLGGSLKYTGLEGEIQRTYNVPFFDITAGVNGSIGSVGVGGKIGFEDGAFVLKSEAAAGVGIGGKLRIKFDPSDVDLFLEGIGEVPAGVSEVAENIGEFAMDVSEMAKGVGEWVDGLGENKQWWPWGQ